MDMFLGSKTRFFTNLHERQTNFIDIRFFCFVPEKKPGFSDFDTWR